MVQADDVTGPYDVILRAEADSIDELGRMVVSQIQLVDGITRTLTCPVVHSVTTTAKVSASSRGQRWRPPRRARRRGVRSRAR